MEYLKSIKVKKGLLLLFVLLLAVCLGSCNKNDQSESSSSSSSSSSSTANEEKKQTNENTPLVLSSQALDGLFNPFFYTSGYDGEIVGMTQMSMLGTSNDGSVKVGDDEPTVVKDYTIKTTDTRVDKDDKEDYDNYYTTYEFLIKDNIKFSDGTPLTIKDVLFNMYVYLDPAYSGSTTMYSVNIKGLKAYRAQTYNEGEQNNFEKRFQEEAEERILNIIYWADDLLDTEDEELFDKTMADIDTVKKLFKEELTTDWNSAESSISDYADTYQFTQAWQVFLYNYNYITVDPNADNTESPEALQWNGWDKKPASLLTKENLINAIYEDMVENSSEKILKDNLKKIVQFYQTAKTAKAQFAAEAKSEYLASAEGSTGLTVPTVDGITTYETKDFNSKSYSNELSVLKIVINGVDPKAIWNFGFTVAPMHYYSTAEEIAKANGTTRFGVKYGDIKFMNQIQAKQVPLGAGAYQATDKDSSLTATTGLSKANFFRDNIVYYKRNDNFLLGKPKIRLVRYKVISSNKLFEAVATGEVHYSDPSAKAETIAEINNKYSEKLGSSLVDNLGYGYIGINAGFVNELNVRRAIMHAMDTSLVLQYYPNEMASIIYRPMTSISWAYPDVTEPYYKYYSNEDEAIAIIQGLVEDAGYVMKKGIYQRTSPHTNKLEKLEYTFTLAGESSDHPAYNTFKAAEELLNKCGFKITVSNDSKALSRLSAGELTVWAAAWSSTIDPDMYQVYHKDSTATSVNNWGYPFLLENGSNEELEILNRLSEYIEEGRQTTVQAERKTIYANALDEVMKLAVELPTYQRKNLFVYDKTIIDITTLQQNVTPYNGPLSRIWEVSILEK